MDNILRCIKKMLGLEEEYTHFDMDIIININTALMTLNQLGIGPSEGVYINGTDDTWVSILGERKDIEAIKTYIYLKVKLLFDPPTSSFVLDSIERQINEISWRLNVQVDKPTVVPEEILEDE